MAANSKSHVLDLTDGPLLRRIVAFAIPCLLSTLLQLTFNAADMVVVGRYGSAEAMGAVGSTGPLIHLQICLFMGLAIGANVLAANFFGAKDWKRLHLVTQTAMAMSIGCGIVLALVLVPCARIFLRWMNTPESILEMAVLYVRIYLSSLPFILIYNFGSAILRAIGDTKRPMYYLTIGGVVNVFLNLFFVVKLHMQADGVAWATFISQVIAATLVWITLRKVPEVGFLRTHELRFDPLMVSGILRVGIPSGLQSSCFGLSNMMIQTAVNSFGALAVAGCAASSSLEGLTHSVSFSFFQVSISFAGQNLGAGKIQRILKGALTCMVLSVSLMMILGGMTVYWGRELLAIYNDNSAVVALGFQRLVIVVAPYGICGIMDVLSGALRGMKHSMVAFILTLFFVCVFRILWVRFVCVGDYHSIRAIMWSYPISWILAIFALGAYFLHVIHKEQRLL